MKNVELTVKECRVICECLWDFKTNIEGMKQNPITMHKIYEVNKLFEKMQVSAEYNFEKQLEKCSKKKANSDIGEDAMLLLTNGYK
ncbi:hypothetical protein FDG04_02300 [Clostridium sporogenes]|uniref:hypothetical protein n=1 Tax=Clostridium sporogenes TaxID=1509 RepID=UPI0013D578ED|nr:hypothetical protein [Clostridium sporogenes]NFQ84164.1 hypothetical protein [Clostridium sporogenes]